jgi:apolipoprotein N-acyltransferase
MNFTMSFKQRFLLSVLSGILFVPAWYTWGTGFILFIAFIPMLLVEQDLVKAGKNSREFFLMPFLSFFIWNLAATWWIKNASIAGAVVAILVNTTFMSIPFWLFSYTHRKLGNSFGYFSLLFYWIAFEYFYLNAEISWTWLNLGNGFANNIRFIQWYEYTGVLGGTFWVLTVNLLLFRALSKFKETGKLQAAKTELGLFAFFLIIPIVLSLFIFRNYTEKKNPYEIVVIQPNIDPYMKFNDIPPDEQMDIFIRLADSLTGPSTDYIVVPRHL